MIRPRKLFCTILFFGGLSAPAVRGQSALPPVKIAVDDPRPLAAALSQLEKQVGIAINYEDPPYSYSADEADVTAQVMTAAQLAAHPGAHIVVPHGGPLSLILQAPAVANMASVAPMVDAIAKASNARRYGADYAMKSDDSAMFVVPVTLRDSTGRAAPASPVFDTPVTFGIAQRSAGEVVSLVLSAIGAGVSTPVNLGSAPFGIMVHSSTFLGADHEPARSVLGRLFSSIASSTAADSSSVPLMGYQLFFDPGLRYYMLNIHVIQAVAHPAAVPDPA